MEREQQRQEDRIVALEKGQQEILNILRPISETYRTATMLGKWSTGLLVLISVIIGIILSIKQIIK